MPPVGPATGPVTKEDLGEPLAQILDPFQEGQQWYQGFWDWWQIGGRYSGSKIAKSLYQEARDAFFKELTRRNVTVSGVQFGEQTLKPESQRPMVDALWREAFPDTPFEACPLFDHSPAPGPGDVMRYGEVLQMGDFALEHLIVAGPHGWHDMYEEEGRLEAVFMLRGIVWNGLNYEDTAWDRTFRGGMALREAASAYSSEAYRERHTPQEDWLVVTIDYHS